MTLVSRDLEVFLAVVHEGSFGRAATKLVLTQPSVSERIVHLERTLGTQLFTRDTRGARLTAAGEQLVPYAQRSLALADEATEAIRSIDQTPRFTVAVHTTFAPRAVPLVLDALVDLPRRISVRDAHSEEVEAMVLDGVANIGFVLPGSAPKGLRHLALPPDPVVSVVAADHPLARKTRPSLRDLNDTFVAVNAWGDGHAAALTALAGAGVPEWRWRRCSDAATAALLARHHDHVAFVARTTVQADLDTGTLVELQFPGLPRWRVSLAITYRSRDRSDSAIAAILRSARPPVADNKLGRTRR